MNEEFSNLTYHKNACIIAVAFDIAICSLYHLTMRTNLTTRAILLIQQVYGSNKFHSSIDCEETNNKMRCEAVEVTRTQSGENILHR